MVRNHQIFPALKTERLNMIEPQRIHAGDIYRLFTDKRVTEFYPVIPIKGEQDIVAIIESFKTRFKEKQGVRWGITLKQSNAVIGTIGFHTYTEGHKASIVFALTPEHQNHGYITEAISEVLRYGFDELGLKRIEAEVMPGNTASEKVLGKTGFNYEGLLRDWMLWNGQYYDINMYSILKREH